MEAAGSKQRARKRATSLLADQESNVAAHRREEGGRLFALRPERNQGVSFCVSPEGEGIDSTEDTIVKRKEAILTGKRVGFLSLRAERKDASLRGRP